MTITLDFQRPNAGKLITLFQLDCTKFLGGSVLYFTNTVDGGGNVTFNGVQYTPVEIQAEGFEYSGNSAFPTPTLRLSNVTQMATALVIQFNDLIGAEVRRIRTFSQYLDNGATPDPLQIFPIDVYRVEQKTKHTRTAIEWKLSASIDQEGAQLPSMQMVRDHCVRQFRTFDYVSGTTSYKNASCPYTGGYIDVSNQATSDPTLDACPKTLTGCKARFGANAPLPFKAFPGLGRFR